METDKPTQRPRTQLDVEGFHAEIVRLAGALSGQMKRPVTLKGAVEIAVREKLEKLAKESDA